MTSSENRSAGAKTILAAIIGHVFWGFSFIASRTALENSRGEIQLAVAATRWTGMSVS